MTLRIGTAGWTIPAGYADRFPQSGTHLQRYAGVFNAVEINSSFKRTHRPSTYRRWRESVPDDFRFSVKFPREITHSRRLVDVGEPLALFLDGVQELRDKLGPLLVQLPPSLVFDSEIVNEFARTLRAAFDGCAVIEPRHPSWFTRDVEEFLQERQLPRAAADPARAERAGAPGGWKGVVYLRLHGSPTVYRSSYSREFLVEIAGRVRESTDDGPEGWVIFDNTAEGQAVPNGIDLMEELAMRSTVG